MMDRELLIEIGVEELPAALAAGADAAAGRAARGAADASCGCTPDVAGRELQHAAAADRARRPHGRAPGGSRRDVTGPPVSAAFDADGEPTPAALGFAQKQGVAFEALERSEDRRRASTSSLASGSAGKSAVDALPDLLGGAAARPGVPEADALGRDARGRPGRAAVRPSDPLAAVPLRRPRRAVHDRPHAERRRPAGAGRRRPAR